MALHDLDERVVQGVHSTVDTDPVPRADPRGIGPHVEHPPDAVGVGHERPGEVELWDLAAVDFGDVGQDQCRHNLHDGAARTCLRGRQVDHLAWLLEGREPVAPVSELGW